jgi:multisubunit Na+/H+ antiporter MnhF subunit
MIEFAINAGLALLSVAMVLGAIRLARGPSVIDRVLAFDLITTCAVGMIVLLSIRWHTGLYLELILIFSLLGFLTTVAFVLYLHHTSAHHSPQKPAKPLGAPGPARRP